MGKVLGIVYRAIASHLIKKAGFTHKTAQTGAVTLIQRFGSALNLNIHFYMLFLDGVYVTDQSKGNRAVFRQVQAPTLQELTLLAQTISERIGRYLERQGLLVRDSENSYLSTEYLEEDSLSQLQGHSITYRIYITNATSTKSRRKQLKQGCQSRRLFSACGCSKQSASTKEVRKIMPLHIKPRRFNKTNSYDSRRESSL